MPRKSENATGENPGEAAPDADGQLAALRAEIAALAGQIAGLVADKSATVGSAVSAQIGERARQGVAQVSAQVSGAASGLVDEFRAASADSLGRLADGVATRTREVSETFIDALSAEVRRNPARTLAVTLGLGLILGAWSRSGTRSGH